MFVETQAECALALVWVGVPTAKGQTVHCLTPGAQPTAGRLCGLHQSLPPGRRLGPDPLGPRQLWLGEVAAETGFPGLTEQRSVAPSDPYLYLAAFTARPLT